MTFATPPASAPAADDDARSRGRVLIPTLLVLGVIAVLFVIFTGFYTDWLWFQSVEKTSVFTTVLAAKVVMFLMFGVAMGVGIAVPMWLAYRFRPFFAPGSPDQAGLERYRESLDPIRKPAVIVIATVIGLLSGISAAGQWSLWMLWRNGGTFGKQDAQFGMDVGFWVFSYPFIRFVLGFLFTVLFFGLVANLVVNYLYGGLQLAAPRDRVSRAARVQISILVAVMMLLKAAAYWLDRYGIAVKDDELVLGFTGLKFRDVNAVLPAKSILVFIALIVAVLFIINIFRSIWTIAMAGVGLMVVSALVIGGIYPAVVQQFQVKPSELVREEDYLARNISATREAWGLDDVETRDYAASAEPNAAAIAQDAGTIANIRLLDPAIVSPTYRALQQIRGFYSFPDILDVDRYNLADGQRGAVVSVRELDLAGVAERNWANDHVVYTHGYGFVAAYDNTANANGTPEFFEYDIPPIGGLDVEQPRVYFGESSPIYSIVGGPEGSTPRELDFPDDTDPTGQRNNTYDGKGGAPVGSPLNKLAFAVKFGEPNILLSDLVNADSRIMWDRTPRERLAKVAPWLTPDGDPYAAVVNGRIVWILDAYTKTDQYPYSTRVDLNEATSDSVTSTAANVFALPTDRVNYMRNSVKAVVDAYDGTVDLYAWDEADPILQAWERSFPGVVQPKAEMDTQLVSHVRYPEDLFKVQRLVYSRYHVTDPAAFYNGQDFWIIPNDPTDRQSTQFQPPYYLTLQMPGQSAPAFSLTTTFSPARRQTLAAFMAVDSAPGDGYGKFRVLQLPRNTTIPGPVQVQTTFESDPEVASQLSLLRRGGSDVLLGNLLSLPVGGGMLYVEPVYVQATEGGYPLLRKVLVSFGNKVGFSDTLAQSLQIVFGGSATTAPPTPTDPEAPAPEPAPPTTELDKALAEAQTAYDEGVTALKNNDFTAYGEAQKKLADALARAQALSTAGAQAPAATPSPSATTPPPSPEASPAA
ncbi:MAG: uncharacterized protein QG597_109 [Actinomycetota bacterium]|nr:uncharacterized protein [Actinomycetota bacterium]